MSKTTLSILKYVIVGILIIGTYIYASNRDKEAGHMTNGLTDKQWAHKMDSVIHSANSIIKAHDDSIALSYKAIYIHEDSVSHEKARIAITNQQFSKIKKDNHAKITHLRNLSTDSLAMFFKNRYGSQKDSTNK